MNAAETSQGLPGPSTAAEVLRLPHNPAAVSVARHRTRSELARLGVGPAVLDAVEVVLSELLGNAVRHARPIAGGALLLGWRVEGGSVTVKVTDGGSPGRVEPRSGDLLAEAGRGLRIVDGLAAEWGVVDHVDGLRTVWATVSPPVRPQSVGRLHLLT